MGEVLNGMIAERTPDESQRAPPSGGQNARAETLADALAPVLTSSKEDIEFWVQIGQLIVLIMILRRL